MKHKLIEIRGDGSESLSERSYTAVCSCGWEESCSRKKEARREYSIHYQSKKTQEAKP